MQILIANKNKATIEKINKIFCSHPNNLFFIFSFDNNTISLFLSCLLLLFNASEETLLYILNFDKIVQNINSLSKEV